MNKNITKNITIGVLGLFLGLSLCYIGYDKLINKENIKEEVNNTQEDNNTNDEIDKNEENNQDDSNTTQEDISQDSNTTQEENKIPTPSDTEEICGSKCYGGISTNALNAIKWFYNNNKLLDIFQLNVSSFDIDKATVDDYFAFTIGYNGGDDISETDLKNGLLKYFEIKDIDKVMEQLKNYKVNEGSFIKSFTYKDGKFTLEHKFFVEYDYNYKLVDYKEENSKELSLYILKCNAYDETDCKDAKTLTLSNTSDGFKIKKLEKIKNN